MRRETLKVRIGDVFEIRRGEYHATKELDAGHIPLISCGDTNNGLVGFYDIPQRFTYTHSLTVAFNGSWPLLAKFHPYRFGAKDDVGVLVPRLPMKESTLLYIAASLTRETWRYSYGRKWFAGKLVNFELALPARAIAGQKKLDQEAIERLVPEPCRKYLPKKRRVRRIRTGRIGWRLRSIPELFHMKRGDFHSLAGLDSGDYLTVSRVSVNNGVVGRFALPDGATVYPKGVMTVSTVGGDTFVQLADFIATDNVVICLPKRALRLTTLFFLAAMLNRQKWRYSYGRQCYIAKLRRMRFHVPVTASGELNEDLMTELVTGTSYWYCIQKRFKKAQKVGGPDLSFTLF